MRDFPLAFVSLVPQYSQKAGVARWMHKSGDTSAHANVSGKPIASSAFSIIRSVIGGVKVVLLCCMLMLPT